MSCMHDGNCRSLFNAVVLQQHPEPHQLLVHCFKHLVKHEKTAVVPYQPWVTDLHNIFNTLDTIDFSLQPHMRMGFTMVLRTYTRLVESDKRCTTMLKKAQEKEWTNEESLIHFPYRTLRKR